jgi:hypothetical protein
MVSKIQKFCFYREFVKKLPLTVWCWRRGGFEAVKLSNRTKIVGTIHFPKLQNSHEAKTVLGADFLLTLTVINFCSKARSIN